MMVKPGKDGAIPRIPGASIQVQRALIQVEGEHVVDGEAGVVSVILHQSP